MNTNMLSSNPINLKTDSKPSNLQKKTDVNPIGSFNKTEKKESFQATFEKTQHKKEIGETKKFEGVKKEIVEEKNVVIDKVQQLKEKLKEKGVPTEELNSIEDISKLKDAIVEELKDKGTEGKDSLKDILEALNSILASMSSLQLKVNEFIKANVSDELAGIKDGKVDYSKIMKIIENNLSEITGSDKKTSELMVNNEIKKNFLEELSKTLKEVKPEVLTKIQDSSALKGELFLKEATKFMDKNEKITDIDAIVNKIKETSMENGENKVKTIENFSSDKGSEKGYLLNKDQKEESFLKGLVAEEKGDKIARVTGFMSHINNVSNNTPVDLKEAMTINKGTATEDIIKTVKFMAVNNLKELTVKINPRELGEVVIKISMEAGNMKANITANNKEAYNILNNNLQDITAKLQNTEIKIENLTLNLYNEDTTFFKDGSSERDRGRENKNDNSNVNSIEDITLEKEQNLSELDGNVNMLA